MLGSSACRPRPVLRGPAVAAALVGLAGVAGCSTAPSPTAAPTAAPTPIERLRTATMQVPRIEFCSLVPAAAVSRAVGGRPATRQSWGNGDRQAVAGGEVVQELGCAWARGTTTARAWVFARPVGADDAAAVVAQAGGVRGCRTPAGPAYGAPAVTQVCTSPAPGVGDGEQRVRHAGLFGDTWLSCELQGPASADLRARADAWCVELAGSLDTAR